MQIFHYKGFHGCDSKCGLEIKSNGTKVTVILTELDDNSGTSVTNMVEQIATMVYRKYFAGVPAESIIWIEHYPPDPKSTITRHREGTFDKVILQWNGKRFSKPNWIPMEALK